MQYMVAGRSSEECKRYRRLREEEVVVDHGEGVEVRNVQYCILFVLTHSCVRIHDKANYRRAM